MASVTAGAQTNFPAVNIGASETSAVSLTIPNAATIGSIAVVTQGAAGLDFTDAGGGSCAVNQSYAASASCSVEVSFRPVFAGMRYGAVLLADSTGNTIAAAGLAGIGMGPQVAFDPGTATAVDPMANGQGLDLPFGVAVDGKGDVYVADQKNRRVVEIPAGGGTPVAFDPMVNGQGLKTPGGVAVDGAGDLFISDLDGNFVDELPAGGGAPIVINPTVDGQGLDYPCGMVIDAAGDLYIADVDHFRVVEIPAGGGAPIAIDPEVNGQKLSYPVTLAMDSAGDLFIADLFLNRVVEVPAGGGTATAIDPVVNGQGLNEPYGIAVDAAGNLFIADLNNRVVEVPANGGAATALTPMANGRALNDPIGVALDAAGDLFIGDSLNDRVVKVQRSQPPALNFAATPAGATSSDSPQTVEVENVGNAALTFPVPASGNNPSISANFTLASGAGSDCPLTSSGAATAGTLAVGSSCLLPISFQPSAAGAVYGTLTLTDDTLNAAGPGYAQQSIALSGNAPVASVSAANLWFGPQQTGVASASQTVMLSNTGSAAMTINSIAVTGANASLFAFPDNCGGHLAAGTSCAIEGMFTPATAGTVTAQLTIGDSAQGSPQSVTLTGTGAYLPAVTAIPSSGSITTAQPLAVTVEVGGGSGNPTPTGTVVVTIGSYSSNPAALSGGSASINVPAGALATGTDSIEAVYTPDSISAATYLSATGTGSVEVTAAITATAPTVTTGAATAIGASTSALAGTVNPNGADTHYWFAYGISSTLSGASQTPEQDLGSAAGANTVSANLTGLSASTMYYYQVVAENSVGTTSGTIMSFTTTPAPYFSITGPSMTVTPGASAGNTAAVVVTSWYGFSGTVSLQCTVAYQGAGTANDPPACSVPGSVVLTSSSTQTVTLTVTTTAASALNAPVKLFWAAGGGTVLACVLLLGVPGRRRSWLAMLGLLVALVAAPGMGCGSGSSAGGGGGGGGGSSNPGTTAGNYTITITGSSGSSSATEPIALTVQ